MAIVGIGDPQKTRPWRPLMGVAVGAVARLTEDIRQQTWDDTVYTEEHYYGLSLRGPSTPDSTLGIGQALHGGQATFIFPVGPQTVRKSFEYRQSTEMTLGGIVAEERGLAYIDFTIEGNFGLGPKYGYDTTITTALPDDKIAGAWLAPLSGPLWTRKMFANFLERYAHMKARPDENAETALVFHDFKNDEHYIVIPQKVELNRTISTRMMYPFTLVLRAIARTEPSPVLPPPITLASLLAGAVNAVRVARTAVNLATSAADTLTNTVSKVRYAAAVIDSVIDEARRAVEAFNTFIDEGKRLADLSNTFADSARQLVEATLGDVQDDPYFPSEAREALKDLVDVYDMMGAQPDFQVTATGEERARRFNDNQRGDAAAEGDVTEEGSPAAIEATGGGNTTRTISRANGLKQYIVADGDTLENIAAREVNDAGAWFQIAIRNGLRAPYISRSGLPGTATIGDTILIPTPTTTKKTTSATDPESAEPVDLYGTDLKVFEVSTSAPGRPRVDLLIDPHTGKDLAVIAGVPNLVQACQMRLWTEQGSLLLSPAYGLPSAVGHPNINETVIALKEAVKSGLKGDSRIRRIESMIVVQEDDIIDIEATVTPVAAQQQLTVGISVV